MRLSLTSQPVPATPAMVRLRESWPILVGLMVLYLPTYIQLATEIWQAPQTFHGALFFVLTLWMFWERRAVFLEPAQSCKPVTGVLVLLVGLFFFVMGRSHQFVLLEVMSQIPVLMGVILAVKGVPALRALWFPIAFLLFLVPIPGSILDALLLPLKQLVSAVVDHSLFAVGYPIARNGVVLMIGGYQLLIADACAGLNSLIALSGIGLAFMYLAGHTGFWRNALLAASVLPIAIFANVLRVACLTLVTYHLGEDVGQRFHNIAGMAEVLFALGTFFVLDATLARFMERRR